MSDYVLRGTTRLLQYAQTLGADMKTVRDRLAAASGLPRILFSGNGRSASSYTSPRYKEAIGQAIAGVLGVTTANVTTNGGQEVVG